MSSESDSPKLRNLRVIDLRAELEKRGLDKNGVKQVLVDRMQRALEEEGLDPETYQFDLDDKKQKRLSTSSRDPADIEEGQIDDATGEGDTKAESTGTAAVAKAEEKENSIDDPEKNEINKEDSSIQLTLEEDDGLHDNEPDSVEESTKARASDPEKQDGKKSTKEGPETTKETTEHNSSQQDLKKESPGDNSDARETVRTKGISDSQNRNLWITNISQNTRATELKQALSHYGKVIGAKVVINARYPGACCYGYVKMETVEDANNCINKLNNTELNGQIIRIEKVRPEHLNPNLSINKKFDAKDLKARGRTTASGGKPENRDDKNKSEISNDDAKNERKGDRSIEKKDKPEDGYKSEHASEQRFSRKRSHSMERRSRDKTRRTSRSRDRHERSLSSKSRRREKEMLTFEKIKDERDRERMRERERLIREEKRRREEAVRQREIDRRQRSEAQRLEREREKLRVERERLERERAEIMQMERERQKLEREKLEREKLELERVKMRMQEEERRKRPAPYSRDRSFEERKRVTSDRHFVEPPPPPRFDPPPSVKTREPSPPSKKFGTTSKDFKSRLSFEKRDSYPSKRDRNYESERSHSQSSIAQRPSQSMVKYDNSQVFNLNRERDMRSDPRQRESSGPSVSKYTTQVVKETRYNDHERDRSPHFRPVRDERDRRSLPDHKTEIRSSRDHRYSDPPKEPGRFERSSATWGHPSPSKVFSNSSNTTPKAWAKDTWRPSESSSNAERWNSGTSRGTSGLSAATFSSNSSLGNIGPSCPPPPGINNYVTDRFEYKSGMSNIRKY